MGDEDKKPEIPPEDRWRIPRDPIYREVFLDGVAYGFALGREQGFAEGVLAYGRTVKNMLSRALAPAAS